MYFSATATLLLSLAQLGTTSSLPRSTVDCSSLVKIKFLDFKIRFTSSIVAGSNFTGDSTETGYNALQTSLPAACRVAAEIQTSKKSAARFEIWLPSDGSWNSRYLVVGNGGWAGGINYPDVVKGLKKGFATLSTDGGHNSTSNDATWTGNKEQMIDFGHRALHLSTKGGKEVVKKFYKTAQSYSYYSGCSTGGRQGWNEAQRYPSDFDGVLVGAPANWMTHLPAWDIRVALQQFPSSKETYIPASLWPVIKKAVLRQCDGLDGMVDNIISDPARCAFRPEVLACGNPGTNSSTCLTPGQISNLLHIYVPWYEANNTFIYSGLSPGSENGFGFLFNGATPQFGIDFFKNAIVNDSSWDYSTISGSTIELADSINPGGINAYDPDLRPFQKKGGKVLQYHGWQDQVIPSGSSGVWYNKVHEFYGRMNRAQEVQDFYRLFMVPGLQHCSGGDGAWVADSAGQTLPPASNTTEYSLLNSLIDWVENKQSTGPEKIVGTKYRGDALANGVQFTRPFCRWPTFPVWNGKGDENAAENWSCPSEGVY